LKECGKFNIENMVLGFQMNIWSPPGMAKKSKNACALEHTHMHMHTCAHTHTHITLWKQETLLLSVVNLNEVQSGEGHL
jgi:hypothetical protein